MSKTISQIAKEIGVSRQAVWQKTKSEQFKEHIKEYSTVINSKLYINEDGEKIIKDAFKQLINERKQKNNVEIDSTITQSTTNEINYNNKQLIDILNQQITNLNKQNEQLRDENKYLLEELHSERKHLNELSDKLAELAANAQKLHAGDIVIPKLNTKENETAPKKKNNIFGIFFKNKGKADAN